MHARAFDRGLLTVDPSLTVTLSDSIRGCLPAKAIEQIFLAYEGLSIRLPEKFRPDPEYLLYHSDVVFRR
jgi:hypothetical protein